ncbi:unnamed protein product [Laminaria digitata]
MLAALLLICVVGACAGLLIAFLSEETLSIGILRARAFEAQRWVKVQLDSLGAVPDEDSDRDLEAGFGEVREALADTGKRVVAPQQSKPTHVGGAVRRSVHRGHVGGGASTTIAASSPSPEYATEYGGSLFERNSSNISNAAAEQQQQQQQQQQLLPRQATVCDRGDDGDDGIHGRRAADQRNQTTSARGNFAHPRSSFPDNPGSPARGAARFPGHNRSSSAALCGEPLVEALGKDYPGEREQLIPVYVPAQKQGGLSKATHRRSSSRTLGAAGAVDGADGEGGAGGGSTAGGGGGGGGGVSGASPPTSPFFAVRSPPRVLPPGLKPQHTHNSRAVESKGFEYDYGSLPPAVDDCLSDQRHPVHPVHARQGQGQGQGLVYRSDGGQDSRRDGALSVSSRRRTSRMLLLLLLAPSDSHDSNDSRHQRTTATTPERIQRLQRGDSAGRGSTSSLFAAPSPDGDSHHKELMPTYTVEGIVAQRKGGKPSPPPPRQPDIFWSEGADSGARVNTPRGEGAGALWPSESELEGNVGGGVGVGASRGTGGSGVRRRVSPRAGGRSPRRPYAGWTALSPRRQDAAGGSNRRGNGNGSELRPTTLVFPDDINNASPSPRVIRGNRDNGDLKVDVRAVEEEARGGGPGDALSDRSKMRVFAEAETPVIAENEVANIATEVVVRQIGLKCSTPIYDRGKNLLGNVEGSTEGQRKAAAPSKDNSGGTAVISADSPSVPGVGKKVDKKDKKDIRTPPPPLKEALGDIYGGDSREELELDNGPKPLAATQGTINTRELVRAGRDLTSSEAFAASLELPFQKLELGELIGGGGFGQVYRGVWRGTPVAIKVLVPVAQRELDDELAADFSAEVLMLAALRHPNVCLFMGACMVPPNRAIVTELLTRGSLWEALRTDTLPSESTSDLFPGGQKGGHGGHRSNPFVTPPDCWPWSVIIKVAEGVACGMNYLHRHEPFPILHRDLKSANMLLDECFNVKICDFGLARLKAFTNSMTGNCGTVQWMAPEVLASEKYAETADVYSFAIVCWELLTRACPYQGLTQIQVAVAVLNDGLRPDIPNWCPEEFASLIKDGWHQEPTRRPSFGDILHFLRTNPTPPPS